jgi:ATP-dependent Clp protease ATP-binding subunit ClpX
MAESEKPSSSRDAWYSFCRRNHREVGPLAEGPDLVFICYYCTQLCARLISDECERKGIRLTTEGIRAT